MTHPKAGLRTSPSVSDSGPGAALAAAALLTLALLSLLAGPSWIALAGVAAFLVLVLLRGGRLRRRAPVPFWGLIGSVLLATAALAFFRWSFMASVDATDDFRPEPYGVQFGGAALIVALVCVAVGLIAAIRLLRRRADEVRSPR